MALIIDFTGKEPPKKTPIPTPAERDIPAELDPKASWDRCKHSRTEISEEQRTVTCKDCGAFVDPIAYILMLYRYYETRVDHRLYEIREFERREKALADKKTTRVQQPRRAKVNRRTETAERAAFNEYQAKVLLARADRQRLLVARLDDEIAQLPPDPPDPNVPRGTKLHKSS